MTMSEIGKKMLPAIVLCVFVIMAVGLVFAILQKIQFLPVALGAVLGAALSVAKVIMIDRTVKKVATMEAGAVGNFVRIQHFLRFVLTAAVLVVAAVVPFINLYSAAAGILSFQAAVMWSGGRR